MPILSHGMDMGDKVALGAIGVTFQALARRSGVRTPVVLDALDALFLNFQKPDGSTLNRS